MNTGAGKNKRSRLDKVQSTDVELDDVELAGPELEEISLIVDTDTYTTAQPKLVVNQTIQQPEIYEVDGEPLPFDDTLDF